jgi:outer membrane receptor protein involved in Fe transport
MTRFQRSGRLASALAALFPLVAAAAETTDLLAQAAPSADRPAPPSAAASAAAQQLQQVDIVGTRQRLDAARNSLSPETGSTIYRFSRDDLQNLPLGDSTPLNQIILRSPGVVQDSYGQLHVRGDHANIQYRIDGVVIPEAISGFGQALEARYADRISILTGALPAQYGYRTAAVIDIQTRGSALENSGRIGVLAGSRGHLEPSLELSGTKGAFSYYLTGSYLQNDIGIENPTADRNAIHDRTNQSKGFGSLSYLIDADSRISVLFGTTNNRFQIPDVPGQTPSFMLDSAPTVDSARLDANQRERNRFGVLTYQGAAGRDIDYQISLVNRSTDVRYRADPVGDLVFNGIAADIFRKNVANSVQGDMSWRLAPDHTLRAGLFAQQERFSVDNTSSVFPADADGNQTSGMPITIVDNSRISGRLWGVYLQDEWRPSKALTVNYGLRYDKVNTVVDESQASPRLGAVYDVTADLRVHAGYARYFTPPPTEKIDTTTIAKFVGTTNALPSDANTAVKSERSDYFDVGLAWQATRELTLGIDGYYRRVRHLQDEGQFGNALIFSAFNYAQGRIGGLELSASYRDRGLTGYANLGFARARGKTVETGQFNFAQDELDFINANYVHLDHEQQLSASAGASYRFADTTSLGIDALYGSGLRKGFANTQHLPSYTQLNLDAGRTFALGSGFGKLDVKLAVLNVLDRSFELRDGSGIGVGAPQFGPRRTYYVGVSKPFTF